MSDLDSTSSFHLRLRALDSMTTAGDMASDHPTDPDAQATVTDFLDYTEYLPADIIRSLTLLCGLDQTFTQNAYAIHEQTRQYGALPKLPASSRPDPQALRNSISTHLDQAMHARQASHAEAVRMFDVADRHYNRLSSIVKKLHALPKPPSRDPTPPPASPETKRSRSGRKIDDGTSTQRLTLNPPRAPAIPAHLAQKSRNRRVTVPGDILSPFNPDSPIASTEQSDWDDESKSPSKGDANKPRKRPGPKLKKLKITNISVPSTPLEGIGALRMPTPPPHDAPVGGEHKPWVRLTEWEMWKLRKKMKKNITWEPSEIMIQRELADKGRGWESYHKAKAEAKTKRTKVLDVDNLDKSRESVNGPKVETPSGDAATVRNRGMKLNEAKKLKRETQAREQASQAAAEAEAAARRLGDIGSAFRNLFSPIGNAFGGLNRSNSSPTANGNKSAGRSRKRKRTDSNAAASPSLEVVKDQKKKPRVGSKLSPLLNGQTETTKIPLKDAETPPSALSTPLSPPVGDATRVTSIIPKTEQPTPPILSRPPSRPSSRRSMEPSLLNTTLPTRASRRTSTPRPITTPLLEPPTPKTATSQTAASRRPKREAPGPLTQSSADGGAAVIMSRRKNKPGPKPKNQANTPTTASAAEPPQIRVDIDGKREIIDPDEERFCVCRDVSFGEMICCEMEDDCLDGQWFHLSCVNLVDLPTRTSKWYSPACRRRWRKGETSNGLVKRSGK